MNLSEIWIINVYNKMKYWNFILIRTYERWAYLIASLQLKPVKYLQTCKVFTQYFCIIYYKKLQRNADCVLLLHEHLFYCRPLLAVLPKSLANREGWLGSCYDFAVVLVSQAFVISILYLRPVCCSG